MIDKKSDIYKRMTMMRNGFNGNGRTPNLFKPEKEGVNNIMDIIDQSLEITDNEISQIQKELDRVEAANHYNGSAWYDFKLHLNGLLSQANYTVVYSKENLIVAIRKKN